MVEMSAAMVETQVMVWMVDGDVDSGGDGSGGKGSSSENNRATPFLMNSRTDGETVSLSKQALSPLQSSSQTLL